ncbi:related to acyl-CoA dehydrogenase [Cephalotrichum gorgonifer]|uniref:Related to acyl-CoA dehydrogenase n=1 Tax=Cephalotrichum gorgonifer TaxID=2041049 RepID=A0AAE8MSQ6_9PEZI|nr:related to acyl-CoA dehydrogenase [Cephalotrichum gorgonifer]
MAKPSSSDHGFFQEAPILLNQFYDDVAFRRAFKLFVPPSVAAKKGPEVAALGEEVLADQIFTWVTDSERNKPYIKGNGRDPFGQFRGQLVVGEGWRKLQEFGIRKGIVATGYESEYGPFCRVVQFLRLHLWTPSSSMVPCPSAMHDGATRLLQLQLASPNLDSQRRRVFQNALGHLLSRDPDTAWTSGQWMTERTGGSDVSLTETLATLSPQSPPGLASAKEAIPLGPWSISGFKWFSSATDSDMTVLLAKTPRGLSAFLAPMRRHAPDARTTAGRAMGNSGTELNGVRIQRLKNKLGTRSLPTAELELRGMRAWLLGEEGRGIHQVSTVLNITRIYSAVSATGFVGRGVSVAKAYARVRSVGSGRGGRMVLAESALHMRTLADLTAEYHGLTHLSVLAAYVLGLEEYPMGHGEPLPGPLARVTPRGEHVAPLLRVLAQVTKAYVCKNATALLYSCMESLGGVGYLENEEQESLNLAKLYRDCCVLAIWEGTTDVLSTDFIRAVKHPRGGRACIEALDAFIEASGIGDVEGSERLSGWKPVRAWEGLKGRFGQESQEELMGDARQIVWVLAEVLITVLLFVDAESDGSPVAADVLRRFVAVKRLGGSEVAITAGQSGDTRLRRDQLIVYGEEMGVPDAKL